jgi:hypothetical protein
MQQRHGHQGGWQSHEYLQHPCRDGRDGVRVASVRSTQTGPRTLAASGKRRTFKRGVVPSTDAVTDRAGRRNVVFRGSSDWHRNPMLLTLNYSCAGCTWGKCAWPSRAQSATGGSGCVMHSASVLRCISPISKDTWNGTLATLTDTNSMIMCGDTPKMECFDVGGNPGGLCCSRGI